MAQNHVLKWPLGKWSPKDPAVCPGSLILSHTHIGNMKIGEFMETRIKPWLFHRVSQTHVNQLLSILVALNSAFANLAVNRSTRAVGKRWVWQ